MSAFFEKIKENIGIIIRILLFIVSIGFIVYLFPKEGKFRYEYQKGKPWMHQNLIAPYDFAVKKLDSEIKKERDSILNQFKPYFRYKEGVGQEQIDNFEERFDTTWNNYYSDYSIPSRFKKEFLNKASREIAFVYTKGIMEFTDVFEDNIDKNFNIVVMHDNVAEEVDNSEVFTLKSAYEYLMENMSTTWQTVHSKITRANPQVPPAEEFGESLVRKLNINEFVYPNLFYDKNTSQKVKKEKIKNISNTRGMVQAGEAIVLKGQVVDQDIYRILESLRKEYQSNLGESTHHTLLFFGQLMLVFISFLVLFLFLYNFHKEILQDTLKISFILVLLVLVVLVANLTLRYNVISIYLVPFALLPIIIKTFFDGRIAFMTHLVAVLILGFIVPNGFEFVFLQFFAGIVAIFGMSTLHRRGQLFATSGLIVLTYGFVYFAIGLLQEGDVSEIDWMTFVWFVGNGLLLLMAYPLIYVFEKLFGFLSDITLIELSDLNHPLLRKLAEKAPGTFQHVMQVANLAEEAIYEIGGNPLLVRTGALYHDIGKKERPLFFIENQTKGVNPHDNIEFDESARIIISHVTKGIEIAHKHNLPEKIIDFIRTHHGTTKVQFFYRSYIKKYPDKEVDIAKFTYPGPTPFSKETAVLMMADSVEAATRSLTTVTKEKINDLIENIIDYQVNENQFYNANITFKDISTIKEIFKEKMQNIYHGRIKYPDE